MLEPIIDEDQPGFLPNKHISSNIRFALYLLDYSYLIPDNSYILFLNF